MVRASARRTSACACASVCVCGRHECGVCGHIGECVCVLAQLNVTQHLLHHKHDDYTRDKELDCS